MTRNFCIGIIGVDFGEVNIIIEVGVNMHIVIDLKNPQKEADRQKVITLEDENVILKTKIADLENAVGILMEKIERGDIRGVSPENPVNTGF